MQNWMPKDDSCSKCPGCKQDLLHSQPKVRVLLIDYTLKYLFCHQDCNIDDVIDNHFTRQMQSVKSQLEKEVQTCTNCEENGTAVSFCLDCSEWLCGVCVIAHQRVRLTKDHNIQSKENVDLQSASSLPKLLRCSIHKENNESRLIQCMSCESLTEIGTHCQHCNAPVSQRISPKKASSILSEGPPVLEKEVNFVLQEAIEIDETEAKTQKILTEEHRTLLPPVPVIDNVHEISDDEIDRTLISSSDDEYCPSRKRPKRKCKKSPFTTPVSSAPSRRGRGRSRLVAPKVVIESSATVEEIEKPSDTPQTSRFEQSNIKQIPISSQSTKPTPVNFGNLCDLRELSLKCRSIRIGSLKTVPQMPINLSLNGIEMVITNPQDISTQSCNIVIPSKDIVQIMCHFGRSLPIMYVYTNTRFSDDIVKKFGKEIYSPSGQDEAKKRIIILPDKFADEDRLIIKNIFKDISVNQKRHNLFAELDVKSANALLVGSTPHEKKK